MPTPRVRLPSRREPRRRGVAGWLVAAVLAGGGACGGAAPGGASSGVVGEGAKVLEGFDELEAQALGRAAQALLAGEAVPAMPASLVKTRGRVFVALRARGEELATAWGPEGVLSESLRSAVDEVRGQLDASQLATVDLIELDLAHDFHDIDHPDEKNIGHSCSNRHRGVRGLELTYGEATARFAPTQMIQDNRQYRDELRRWWKSQRIEESEFASSGRARWFAAEQVLVDPATGAATRLLRGNVVVRPDEVTAANVRTMADLAADWLIRHIHDDGRMTYLWFPKDSVEMAPERENNMIRQWMATNALEKVAAERGSQELYASIEKNIDYNLEHFYRQQGGAGGFGYIDDAGRAKLGAISLATLALVQHPRREKWREQEEAMRRTVDELWHPDGSFDTLFVPRGRGEANLHNFYPGETLLLWAVLYDQERDPQRLEKFMKSFEYYSKWHLEHRKPSFIPWHTQAYYIVWSITKEPRLAEFVFEMNDWLIEVMQEWEDDEVTYADEKGRFFSREHEKDGFGPPHASSTGVYLEGLIDAYRMARELGDTTREERYRKAMARGLRSVMQLQYVDDVDMYYVTNREMTRGGIRTTEFRNEIRVDNVQHNLMGILKILREVDDYSTD